MQKSINNKGFTIIELLIVIVIIGILVAITAVSYTGITNGANTATAQANANAARKKAQACYAVNSAWPTAANLPTANCGGVGWPTGVTIGTPAAGTQKTVVGYNETTGAVSYWNSTLATPAVVTL